MPRSLPAARRRAAAVTAAALAASGLVALTPLAATAAPDASNVVITEVYGGGGNSGAAYQNDFVELYNPTVTAIDLSGLTLDYKSATGGSGGTVALRGSIPAAGYFLVQLAAGNGGGQPLPAADQAAASPNLSGSTGRVYLHEGTGPYAATTGDLAGADGLIDMVGWGSGAAAFEGAPAAGTANGTSTQRVTAGVDTDVNAADFHTSAPTPQGSGGTTEPEPTPDPVAAAIREVQGTGAVSPLAGRTVTVAGVVTADWRDRGFNGFVVQDPAGDPNDGASDAVFVWGDRARAEIGQSVRVTGTVSEYNGLTEITADAIEVLPESLGEVAPLTEWAAIATPDGKEAHESELVLLNDQLTVTDNYDANVYGTFTLAYGDEPLRQPTAGIDPHDTAAIAAAGADNAARSIILDDARSTNYTTAANTSIPFAYLTPDTPVSVGARVAFVRPFVLDYRYDAWALQPTTPVTGDGSAHVTFGDVRAQNAAREDVGGDIAIATFNVLNYFPTTAAEYVALGLGTCTTYNDRTGTPITARDCGETGPRGAATTESFERQEAKIVNAISALDASIVSLEEIENSAHFGKDRDAAVSTLVAALNEKDGAGVWAYVPSPAEVPASEDVIRNAFIYRTADVEPVGESIILTEEPAFDNARQPLFQAFTAAGADDADAFLVSANHFKSKGSGTDDGTGQGNANPDRVAQAHALVAFTAEVQARTGIEPVFLAGDFNAYAAEDPARVIEAGGYTNLNYALNGGEATYNYDGLNGSLDHVFANAAALELVTGVDVWQINAQEQIAFEYSRYNGNATLLYDDSVFRSSDHNPIVVGIDLPEREDPEPQPGAHPGKGGGVVKGPDHPGQGKGVDKGAGHPGTGWKKRV